MSDLYGTNGQAIMMGNAHMDAVRDLRDRVRQHNQEVTDKIQGLKSAQQTFDILQQAKDQAQNLWIAKDIPGKVQEYNKYFADRAAGTAKATNPGKNTEVNLRDAMSEKQLSKLAGGEAETALKDADKAVVKGLAKEGENLVDKTALGAVGEKVGVLGSAAIGGMDLYEDIKSGGIQGNNTWEKAGNVLQIGGAVADIAGNFFPPAKLVGGILDLSAGVTESIGDKLDENKKSDDLKKEQEEETETPPPVSVSQPTIATGRVQ